MLSPEDVSRVTDDVQFRRYFDCLLQAEKRRIGAPGSVEILTKDNTKDDGVDGWAELSRSGLPNSSPLFPHDRVFYQLKIDATPEQIRSSLDKHGAKTRLGAHLKAGGHYVVVIGAALTLPMDDDRRKAVLDGLGLDHSLLSQVHVVSAARLCALTRPHLDLYVSLGLPDLGSAETMDEWHARLVRTFRTSFEDDSETKAVADAVQSALGAKMPLLCLVGPSGSGKSRTVYNALASATTSPVVYFATPALLFESSLLSWLKRQPTVAVVVVDGCATNAIQELQQRTMSCRSTVIAISESAKVPAGVPRIDWKGPTTDALDRIIASTCPKLIESERKWVVATCGRNPLMALQLGTKLQDTPPADRHKILSMHEEERALQLLPEGTEKLAMHLALFDKIGYRGEVAREFDELASFLGLRPDDARELVSHLTARELIQGQKYIALRPVILRAQLLKNFIQKKGGTAADLAAAITALRQALPSMPVDERIMGGLALAVTATNQPGLANVIVGPAGLFATMEDLNERANTFRLQTLAEGAPEQVLTLLERLLGDVPSEKLLALKEGRRGVVPALETIATEASLFERAARLLVNLAIHENEQWSNNAVGSFAELFSPAIGYLAPTAAPGKQRIEFLARVAQDQRAWPLVAGALRQLFSLHHVRTVSSDPTSRSNLPGWTPRTWGEVHDFVAAGWDLAERTMGSSPAIAEVAYDHVRNLYGYRILRPRLVAWLDQKAVAEEDARALDAVTDILAYDAEELKEDVKPLETIVAKVLAKGMRGKLLRYVVISPVHDEARKFRQRPLEEVLEEIAKQAVSEANPQATADFLFARKAARGSRLAFFIGKHDPEAKWWNAFSHDLSYATSYLLGLRQAKPSTFDEVVGDVPQTMAGCRALATSLQGARDVGRLVRAVGSRPENAVGMGIWPGKLRPEELSELVEVLIGLGHEAPRQAGLETGLLYGHQKEELVLTRDAALTLIKQDPGRDDDVREVSLYSWTMLASALAKKHPDTVDAILDRIEELAKRRSVHQHQELARLVQLCAAQDLDSVRNRVRLWLGNRRLHILVGALLEPDRRQGSTHSIDENEIVAMLLDLPERQAVAALNVLHLSWPGRDASPAKIEESAIARVYARLRNTPGIDSAMFNSLSRGGWGDPAEADRRTAQAYREMAKKIPSHPFAEWLIREADSRDRTAAWWDEMKEDEGWA